MRPLILLLLVLCFNALKAQGPLDPSRSDVDQALAPFYHGVASGDPLTDRVILWTRITTQNVTETIGWQIATDTGFTNIVNSGTLTTDTGKDHTVKVDATGLQPGTWYYYRFSNNGTYSITGRTKTAPAGSVSNLRFAVLACSNYQSGYFNAYRDIINKNDVDAVLHLGDYYYEYGTDDFDPGVDSSRLHEPETEITTLEDYRLRNSFYKLDPDLRTVHQQFPFVVVWDDHESANDSWADGAENHTPGTEGNWPDRKEWSRRAYFEWMPIRDVHNSIDTIHRLIPMGNLADLIMIDSRLEGREEQIGTTGAAVTDTNRTMLGAAQLQWLKDQLSQSAAKWKLIGNQVMIAPLVVLGNALNQDQWDGYPAERAKILRHISDNNIDNVVVLTGDIHTSWANDVPHPDSSYSSSNGKGSACVEYVCTSVTSGSFITFSIPASLIPSIIPHVKYADLAKRGYLVLDLTPQRVQGDWLYTSTVASRTFTTAVGASWCTADGANRLTQCAMPLQPRGTNPPIAPIVSSVGKAGADMVMISCYPNPFADYVKVQYYVFSAGPVQFTVSSLDGKVMHRQQAANDSPGLYQADIATGQLAAGTYLLSITAGNKTYTQKMVKR